MRKLKKEELNTYTCSFCDLKDISALFKTELEARVYSCFKHQPNLVNWEKEYWEKSESRNK